MQNALESSSANGVMAAPDHILVATDLTDFEYLMPHVVAQAQASGASVTLVHAVLPSDYVPSAPEAIPYVDKATIIHDAQVTLRSMASQIESRGITCDTAVRDGAPSEMIQSEIGRTRATRLILGTHGRNKFSQLILGSVALQIIPRVTIPIFLVGPHARDAVQHAAPRKILHPVSLLGNYQASAAFALELAHMYRAELTFLHVLDSDVAEEVNPQRTVEWAKQALKTLTPDGTALLPPVRTQVTTGKVAQEILKIADRIDADWIVLGADAGHRHWPFNESTTYKVVAKSTRPVLTLRHEPHPEARAASEQVHFTFPV